MKFFPKSEKMPEDAVKIDVIEEAKKGRGYYSPYSEWEADISSGNPKTSGNWTIRGKRSFIGWSLSYSQSRLVSIAAPTGKKLDFTYDDAGLKSVSQEGVAFVAVERKGTTVSSITVSGIKTLFAYADRTLEILPHTKDGKIAHPVRPLLVSMHCGSLAPVEFGYSGNYLSSIAQDSSIEHIAFERHDRGVRILSDCDYRYTYGNGITLKNAIGATANFRYDEKTGVFSLSDFTGRKATMYYFMRYDVTYLGKVRKIVDGKGNDLVGYRYDEKSGNVTRIRDRFGNDKMFEYDSSGRLAKVSRRAHGGRKVEPVVSFSYAKGREPVSISLLNPNGASAVTTRISRDRAGRAVSTDDGRGATEISYNRFGFPVSVKSPTRVKTEIRYNTFNVPESIKDVYGVATEYVYNDAGLVTRIVRKDGVAVLSFLDVTYDKCGHLIEYLDQDGLCKSFERDSFGRILKERFPDGSECAYAYDRFGCLTSVLDENDHEIAFSWSRFGLESRTTAVDQLAKYVRDDDGLVKEVVLSWNGKTDRKLSNSYDEYGRLVRVDYSEGGTETFSYDKWNRLASRTRGKIKETYAYDYFGRLVEKTEDGISTRYTYDAWGNRTSRIARDRNGIVLSSEKRTYDRFGRLASTTAGFGANVTYAYDAKGRLSCQVVDGSPIDYEYTRYGQLAGKYLGGKDSPETSVEYEYSKSGRIIARIANGIRQTYEYDRRGQLLAVKENDGKDVERYVYDRAGVKSPLKVDTSWLSFVV